MSFWKPVLLLALVGSSGIRYLGRLCQQSCPAGGRIPASPEQVLKAAEQAFQVWKRGELGSVAAQAMEVKGISRTNFFNCG